MNKSENKLSLHQADMFQNIISVAVERCDADFRVYESVHEALIYIKCSRL